jgi:hypothetical protein
MQREKERINKEKIIMGANLAERKKLLLDKVSNILSSGNYKNKEDIYKKVFNNDELQTLGYNETNANTNTKNNEKKKATNNNKTDDGFFVTQNNGNKPEE